jgi:mRNA interferase RelE/StbE
MFPVYAIEFAPAAARAFRRLPKGVQARMRAKLDLLARGPYAKNNNATKLQGRSGYRLRVGDWRIVYEIISERAVVVIIDVGPRGSIYE